MHLSRYWLKHRNIQVALNMYQTIINMVLLYISRVVKNKLILSSIHKYEHPHTRTYTKPLGIFPRASPHVRFFSILDS